MSPITPNPGAPYRVRPVDEAGFTTQRVAKLQHNFHEHPMLQLPALAQLAKSLEPLKQCRFVRKNITQGSSFKHDYQHPDGRSIDEVFERIHEPHSWIALYNIEANPDYARLLGQIVDTVRPQIEREQPGIFLINGFMFISAPPSVTPFHIDRENNFWLQLHGRKTMNVWDHTDREVVDAPSVEDFIVNKTLSKVRLKEEFRTRSHEFDTGPGDGVYFPSLSPHMTRSEPGWVTPGNGVSVSLGVTFYTSVTRQHARVYQVNRLMRNALKMQPREPGQSAMRDSLKASVGGLVGAAHYRRTGVEAPPGVY
ncbi:JmjC domain-containing protein [Variovorax rhizosphaerae]|uniref:Cupin domain-containing protein n=1 Tax=Variovorax rhizosphaerae TaxID=1836200 RepID=A0ABU8WJI6_9BURK